MLAVVAGQGPERCRLASA